MNALVRVGIAVVAVIVGLVFVPMCRGSKAGNEVKSEMQAIIRKIQGYDKNKEYIDYLFENYHEDAFKGAYSQEYAGRRRYRENFDSDKYMHELLDNMARQAKADGSKHIADAISKLRSDWDEGRVE